MTPAPRVDWQPIPLEYKIQNTKAILHILLRLRLWLLRIHVSLAAALHALQHVQRRVPQRVHPLAALLPLLRQHPVLNLPPVDVARDVRDRDAYFVQLA